MATKQLKRNVVVGGVVYGPEGQPGVTSEVPGDVLDRITNPAAFEEVDEPTPAERIAAAEEALEQAREDAAKQAEADAAATGGGGSTTTRRATRSSTGGGEQK